MINLNINDQFVSVPAGTTVLAAAQKLKINILFSSLYVTRFSTNYALKLVFPNCIIFFRY